MTDPCINVLAKNVISYLCDIKKGEIYFDGMLVRTDGRFALPELYALNSENLAHPAKD